MRLPFIPRREYPTPILQVRQRVSDQRHYLTLNFLAELFWWFIGCIICQQVVLFLPGIFQTLFFSRWILSSLSNNSSALDLRFSWVLPHCSFIMPSLGLEQSRFHKGIISALLTSTSSFILPWSGELLTSFSIASSLQPL